jgi:hypothetical protein
MHPRCGHWIGRDLSSILGDNQIAAGGGVRNMKRRKNHDPEYVPHHLTLAEKLYFRDVYPRSSARSIRMSTTDESSFSEQAEATRRNPTLS